MHRAGRPPGNQEEVMTVDYRKLLKDCVRGMIVEWDIPAVPIASWHEGSDEEQYAGSLKSTYEELEVFFDLVAEVMGEEPEPRQSVLDHIARLERNFLGGYRRI
jgi:hypothetical protein